MSSNRLVELVREDDIESARMLARGMRQSDDIFRIELINDSVHVETENFKGVHNTKIVDDGSRMVQPNGEYILKSNEVDFKFQRQSTDNDKLRKIYSEINNERNQQEEQTTQNEQDEQDEQDEQEEHISNDNDTSANKKDDLIF
jgi:Mg-chelatase subunit ChlI